MKFFLSIILICFNLYVYSQSFTENDLKKIAQEITDEAKETNYGNGITLKGCFALNRTLIYQYDVGKYWDPPVNIKEDLIAKFKKSGDAEIFFNNDINAVFCYYSGNKLLKRVSIKSKEFSNTTGPSFER